MHFVWGFLAMRADHKRSKYKHKIDTAALCVNKLTSLASSCLFIHLSSYREALSLIWCLLTGHLQLLCFLMKYFLEPRKLISVQILFIYLFFSLSLAVARSLTWASLFNRAHVLSRSTRNLNKSIPLHFDSGWRDNLFKPSCEQLWALKKSWNCAIFVAIFDECSYVATKYRSYTVLIGARLINQPGQVNRNEWEQRNARQVSSFGQAAE